MELPAAISINQDVVYPDVVTPVSEFRYSSSYKYIPPASTICEPITEHEKPGDLPILDNFSRQMRALAIMAHWTRRKQKELCKQPMNDQFMIET